MNNDVFAERVRNKSNPASSWDSWVQIQAESLNLFFTLSAKTSMFVYIMLFTPTRHG